jgi:tetratricopeptide (TPR) repeat protein
MQHTVEQHLAAARACQSSGDLPGAIREYESAARASRKHPAIVGELIGAQLMAGEVRSAIKNARQLVAAHPHVAGAHLLLAQALAQGSESRHAFAELERARRIDPRLPDAPAFQGTLHARLGEHADSERCFREALALAPAHTGLLANLGHALKQQGKLEEAADVYRQAATASADKSLLVAYAETLASLGRGTEASAILEDAARETGEADLHHALGNLYHDQGRLEEAAEQHRHALRARPEFADAFFNLGMVEGDRNQWSEAKDAFKRALELDPTVSDYHHQLVRSLYRVRDIDAALAAATDALRATRDEKFEITRGHLLRYLGRLDEAAQAFGRVASAHNALRDDLFWDAKYNLWWHLLAARRLTEGWREHSSRKDRRKRGQGDARVVEEPETLFGAGPRHVFLDRDQGIGDQLFFLRYAPAAGDLRGSPLLVDAKLRPLLRRCDLPFDLIERPEEAASCDARMWISDLPLASPAGYPAPVALAPLANLVEEVRDRLARCGAGPYIGVTWRAGPKAIETLDTTERYIKDVDAQALGHVLANVPGTVVVLQRGLQPGEGEAFVAGLRRAAFDFSGYGEDLERMLALLSALDEYVTVSNTNVHLLAGLHGRSARVLVPFPPEWRWPGNGPSSPWFPGFEVYREERAAGWAPVLEVLNLHLRERWASHTAMPSTSAGLVPVAPAVRFSRARPSPRYAELPRALRETTPPAGQVRRIKALMERTGAETMLAYRPTVARPETPFDGVACADFLQHCPEEDLEWVIAEMFSLARRFVFASIALPPAGETYLTQRAPKFWDEMFSRAAQLHPGVAWEVYVTVRTPTGGTADRRVSGVVSPQQDPA